MELTIIDSGRSFTVNVHCLIHDQSNTLILASFGGFDTSVKAVSSSLIEGRKSQFRYGKKPEESLEINAISGHYKRVERQTQSEAITHCVVLHKAAVFEEGFENPVIIAQDGNLKRAIGEFLSAKYALPQIWVEKYVDLIPFDEIEQLAVYISPLYQKWTGAKAVRLSSKVNKDFIYNAIDQELKAGRFVIPPPEDGVKGVFDRSWDMKTLLTNNARILQEKLAKIRPRHVPGEDKLHHAIAEMGVIPFPAQAHGIKGLVNNFVAGEFAQVACGDMGTGKSVVSLGVTNVLHSMKVDRGATGKGFPILQMAPGITIPKWVRKEIRKAFPEAKVRVLRRSEDAGRLLREVRNGYYPDDKEFILVGTDRAKLGPERWCAAVWREVHPVLEKKQVRKVKRTKVMAWHCPKCGRPLEDPDAPLDGDTTAFWEALAEGEAPPITKDSKTLNGLPVTFKVHWKVKSKLKKCSHCKEKLWRPALKHRGESKNKPRWFIGQILKKLGRYFEIFIADEIQECAAEDSGRGDALATLIKSAKKVLGLTGTLTTGQSTSIKEWIWRTNPGIMLKEGFNHRTGKVSWAARYGTLKRVTKVSDDDTGVVTRKKKTQFQPQELPGIAPQLAAHYLLHNCIFTELSDLGLPLIELNEEVRFLEMDDEHKKCYRKFHDELHSQCSNAKRNGFRGAFAKFVPSVINYADRPDLGAQVVVGGKVVFAKQFKQNHFHAKEREMVKIVREEISQDRGCMVLCEYTDNYQVHRRIEYVLAAHGIKCAVLTSSVPQERRVEWLAERVAEGIKVIVSNSALLEVGIDAHPFPTALYYQGTYRINRFRQSSRRAWRIGQHRACKTILLVYNGTQQISQFERMMSRRAHAMIVEGRLDRSQLAQYGKDSHNTLAADLASCLAGAELAQKWKDLAKKDFDQNVVMVSEDRFKEVIAETMTKLAEETKRLCGVKTVVTDHAYLQEGKGLPGQKAYSVTAADGTVIELPKPLSEMSMQELSIYLPDKPKKKNSKKNLPEQPTLLSMFEAI